MSKENHHDRILCYERGHDRSGRVLAVDFQDEMLDFLRHKLAAGGAPRNVDVIRGEARATNVAAASCDRVLIANVWH